MTTSDGSIWMPYSMTVTACTVGRLSCVDHGDTSIKVIYNKRKFGSERAGRAEDCDVM